MKTISEIFKPGDFVDTGQGYFGIGRINDILESGYTGNTIVIIQFVRNIGMSNRYGGDMLFVTPEHPIGTENWKKISRDEFVNHLETRRKQLYESLDTAAETKK